MKCRRHLIDALSITPSYLRTDYSDRGLVTDYRDWQIPLGRRFRALKIWFVMRTYGVEGFKAHIRKHVKFGELFHSLVKSRPDLFHVLTKPAFALTVLHVVPRPSSPAEVITTRPDSAYTNDFTPDSGSQAAVDANSLTKEVYETINQRGEIYITSSVVAGIYTIRVVSANPMAEEKYIHKAFEILVKVTQEVLDSHARVA